MAAVTQSDLRFSVWGDRNVVTGTLTVAADADTWAVPGMSIIDNVIAIQTDGTTQGIRMTISGGTITFADVAAGSIYRVTAFGS